MGQDLNIPAQQVFIHGKYTYRDYIFQVNNLYLTIQNWEVKRSWDYFGKSKMRFFCSLLVCFLRKEGMSHLLSTRYHEMPLSQVICLTSPATPKGMYYRFYFTHEEYNGHFWHICPSPKERGLLQELSCQIPPSTKVTSLAATDWARDVTIRHEAGRSDIILQKFEIGIQRAVAGTSQTIKALRESLGYLV